MGRLIRVASKNVSAGVGGDEETRRLTAYFLLELSMTWAEMTSAVNVGFLVGDVFSTVKTKETKQKKTKKQNRGNDS